MNLKTDTKEKFTVITVAESELTANMSASLQTALKDYITRPLPHLILNMKEVMMADEVVLKMIYETQQLFYNDNFSFVVCCIQNDVASRLEAMDLLDTMNQTPTESEAWDILQMEEIERELMTGFQDN
jgi:anti-anti-sigma factor